MKPIPAFAITFLWLAFQTTPLFGQAVKDPAKKARGDTLGDPLPDDAVARLGTTRLYHEDAKFLAFTPDAKHFLTAGSKGELRLWQVKTGKLVRQWRAPPIFGFSPSWSFLAVSRDSKLVSLMGDKTVSVWELATGNRLLEKGIATYGMGVCFSPGAELLALGEGDRVRLISVATGELQQELRGPKNISQIAFSADGKKLIAAGHNQPDRKVLHIEQWSVVDGKASGKITFEAATSFASKISPDGKHLVVPDGKGEKLRIWDTATGKLAAETEGEASYPAETAFSGDGTKLTTRSKDGKLRLWEVATGKLLREFATTAHEIGKVAQFRLGAFH